mmetsp:Transcript_39571/g.47567  ORF Transcript_39571/g.47567 Transcript_39571/m.47567 type:complete len:171 (-) Transcript_39571:241-753(-)
MGVYRSQRSVSMINDMHKKDLNIGLLSPWVAATPTIEIDKGKEYFCVATWGTMSMWSSPKFAMLTSKIGRELHSLPHGHLIGETRQIQALGLTDFRAETFTVWHERAHMAAFYKSGAHQHAMTSMKDAIDFRVRRVWVKGSDLPSVGDNDATKAFVLRIKSGGFAEAVKA